MLASFNIFTKQMKFLQIPLITFPGIHLGIIGLVCITIVAKKCKDKFSRPLIFFWLFCLYINIGVLAFRSEDY
jgi:hypothetical protein